MSSATAKFVIPYPVAGDAVNQEPVTVKALADRMDLLLGESGSWSPVLAAGVAQASVIVLGRTYPGNSGAAVPGTLIVTPGSSIGSGAIVQHWVSAWTGTATTITGFTLNVISSTATTRTFLWRFLPSL
jgi:hypothetical protein